MSKFPKGNNLEFLLYLCQTCGRKGRHQWGVLKVWVWISGGICQLLANVWQRETKKSTPVCRLKLCTQRSAAMTENLSLLKAANICCIHCYAQEDPQGTFYYIHDCLHLTVLLLLVTFTTYYTQNLLFKGYVRALGNFSHCVGVGLSSEQRLRKLERRQNPWFLLTIAGNSYNNTV